MKKNIGILLVLILLIPSCKQKPGPYSLLKNGDIIFQRRLNPQFMVMSFIDASWYNHCGMIVKKSDDYYVFTSENSVGMKPLAEWIQKGVDHKYSIYRIKPELKIDVSLVLKYAMMFRGRVYDYKFDWDDKKLYDSELIQKSFLRSQDVYLGQTMAVLELMVTPDDSVYYKKFEGYIPLHKEIVSVRSILESDKLQFILGH